MALSTSPVLSLAILCTVMLLTITQSASAETVYILPSDNTPCPVQTTDPSSLCFTLTQYAQLRLDPISSPAGINSSVVLKFVPGQHLLDARLQVQNVSSLMLKIDSSLTGSASIATIMCSNSTGFLFEDISEVSVSGLVFNDCRENSVRSIDQLRMEDCRFEIRHGIELRSVVNATFERSSFFSLDAFVPRQSTGSESGGAVYATDSNMVISECVFELNSALGDGGVIWADSGSIVVRDSTFNSNFANGDSGVFQAFNIDIDIRNSTFTNNTAGDDAGVMRPSGGSVSISDSTFSSNRAGDQGGVFWLSSDITIITQSTFNDNSAEDQGGVMWVANDPVTIIDSSFNGNSAADDGGVIWTSSSTIDITGSNFTHNDAIDEGGVIRTAIGSVSANFSRFTHNRVFEDDGGVISVAFGNIAVYNCLFDSNSAAQDGGVIDSSSATIVVFQSIFSNNTAGQNGAVIECGSSCTHDIRESIFSNNTAGQDGAVIECGSSCTHDIRESIFSNNTAVRDGGVIYSDSGTFNILESIFSNNTVGRDGAVIDCGSSCTNDIRESIFSSNTAGRDGGVIDTFESNVNIYNSSFHSNTAIRDGGVIDADGSNCDIYNCSFTRNTADRDGGALDISGTYNIENSYFEDNEAFGDGSAIDCFSGVLNLTVTNFINNIASESGTVRVFECSLNTRDSNFTNNQAKEGGAMWSDSGSVTTHNTDFNNNVAVTSGGAIYVQSSGTVDINDSRFNGNRAAESGGALYFGNLNVVEGVSVGTISNSIFDSNHANSQGGVIYVESRSLDLTYFNLFTNNSATTGVVFATRSTLVLSGNTTFLYNQASFYAFESNITFDGYANFLNNSHIFLVQNTTIEEGGAVTSYQSDIVFNGTVVIMYNEAQNGRGGAILSLADSRICTYGETTITQNTALTGGGVYANDSELNFKGKTLITENFETLQISHSQPESVRVCVCISNLPNCDTLPPTYMVKKGETFTISLITVNQDGNPVPASVRAFLPSNLGALAIGEYLQETSTICTKLNYTITSTQESEQLVLVPDVEGSQNIISVNVTFLPCICPIGFVNSAQDSTCTCDCDPCLFPEYVTKCSVDSSSVQLRENVWVSFIDDIDDDSGTNTDCPYLIHSQCPLDYCQSSSAEPVVVNFNTSTGPDVQCAFNRAGRLCGSCKDDFSLTLGFSQCRSCSNNWLALLIVFAVAGVALVAFILACNLTVAIGTVNGLIFYANILKVNRIAFFPFQSPNFFTVFIAWINLDFGFVTCFYDGMDAYGKEWLQLVFPVYIILIGVIVLIVSMLSKRIATLFTQRDLWAMLATLILLSYSKYLHFVSVAFSSTTIEYPNGSREQVWLIDANVDYLRGKHIPLFLIALIILILAIVFGTFVFSYQWLILCLNKLGLKTAEKFPTFDQFMTSYLAPFNVKHRFWTGLLLLTRVLLYLISISGRPQVDLLSINCVLVCLLLQKFVLQDRVYKDWPLDVLETTFVFNLLLFSVGSLYVREAGGNQEALAYISTVIAFITFLCILIYHTFTFILPKKLKNKLVSSLPEGLKENLQKKSTKPPSDVNATSEGNAPEKVPIDETNMDSKPEEREERNYVNIETGPPTMIN